MVFDPQQLHTLLDELDTRQDEVIAQLDDLNTRIESILKRCGSVDSGLGTPTTHEA